MARIRANFFSGTLSSQLFSGTTSMSVAALSSFPVVASPDIAVLTIDPGGSSPEIVYVTAHSSSSTSATITRGREGTTSQTWPAGTAVQCDVLVSDLSKSININDSAGTFDLFRVQQGTFPAAPNDSVVVMTDSSDQSGIHKILLINDKFGQPIGWMLNEGGWIVSDDITFMRGSDLKPMVRLCWLSGSTNTGPAIVFGYSGSGGGTVTANSTTVTLDAFMDNWLRLTDDNALQWPNIFRTGWTGGITNTGQVGPGSEPGFAATNVLGTGTTSWYREGASIWRTAATVKVDGPINPGNFVVKGSDTSRTSTASLANDPDLVIPVVANATYVLNGYFIYEASTAGDFSFDLTKPSGTTLNFNAVGIGNTQTSAIGSPNLNNRTGGTALSLGGVGSGNRIAAHLRGLVQVSSTAGNLTLQWAQTASDATATILGAGSWMRLERVA